MKIFILLSVLFFGSAYSVIGTLGVASSVTANTDVTITYGIGAPTLVIRVDQNSQVTLSSYVNIQATLPNGFSALSFGAQVGFRLDITPANAVIISAELTTPSLTAGAAALLTGSVSAGCLQFDANAQAYSQVYIDSYNALSQSITITLPTTGIFIFVGVQQDVPIPTFYNQARQLAANVRTQLSYAGGFLLDVTAETSADITITYSEEKPPTSNSPDRGFTSINAFFEINLSSSSQLEATLNYTYDETVLETLGVVAESLQWGYYDEQNETWSFEGDTTVDTNAMVVSKTVTHFSTWGIYASGMEQLLPSFLLACLAFFL